MAVNLCIQLMQSHCLCAGIGVVNPGRVLADVNPDEPGSVYCLHHSYIDGDEPLLLFL